MAQSSQPLALDCQHINDALHRIATTPTYIHNHNMASSETKVPKAVLYYSPTSVWSAVGESLSIILTAQGLIRWI